MSPRTLHLFALLLFTIATAPASADESESAVADSEMATKLLRFPDVHGDQVVFCYAGDLWRASTSGGLAVRLTAHPGLERFPKFSPDGRSIAFTGQYDGDEQVYIMPAIGGQPQQLTYYPARGPLAPRWGSDNQVYGWTPDGSAVLFRSLRDADRGRTVSALYTVPTTGGLPVQLPMPTAGAGDFSPDGKKLVYSPLFRDFRTWKRYEGGWAQDLYIFDLDSNAVRPIAISKRTERDPMWIGDTIYFVSDRDDTLNLFAYDLATESIKQLTNSTSGDIRWASSDSQGRIIYELDGELSLYDTAAGETNKLSIRVPTDGLAGRPSRYSAADNIEDFELSPKGERALFVARGDVFTAPIEKGVTRNLTHSSDAHDKHAVWSPDGSQIAYVSDLTGEEQIYVVPQDGSSEPTQLTDGLTSMLFALRWSPVGTHLSFSDKFGKLHILDVKSRELLEVADRRHGILDDYSWSPCGGHIALALSEPSGFEVIHIFSLADRQLHRVTDGFFEDTEPTWGPQGDYLFFVSRREFAPQISVSEWNFATNRMNGVFAFALRRDVPHLFPPQNDEVTLGKQDQPDANKPDDDENSDEEKTDEEKTDQQESTEEATQTDAADSDDAETESDPSAGDKHEPTKIDFDGLADRVIRVPIEADNLGGLVAIDGHLLYSIQNASYYGRDDEALPELKIFSIKDRESSTLVESVRDYAVSRDGKKLLIRTADDFQLMDAKAKATDQKTVSTAGLMVDRVPTQEWAVIFDEVWRRFRDFFYVRNMHGYDWQAIGDRYRALLPHVGHRSDLNYLLGEMVAELSAGHCYLEGGDFEVPDRPVSALPGARFELDAAANRYRFTRIFAGDNQEPKYRSPLSEVGVDVEVGNYLLAIDGQELLGSDNPYRLLQHKPGPVTLTVNSKPAHDGAHQIIYKPLASEAYLLYLSWVNDNRRRVDAASDGRVGYLHIPDMSADGIYEFIKWYYPQIRKQGLVVDVRSNGGGNVSQWIIERLDSKLLGTRFGSTTDVPGTYPQAVFHGHMVCVINQTSASDGDIFPHRFRQSGLGPLIGKRTWGGVVGISSLGPLLDGGTVLVPLSATNAPTGEYIIEGHGVDPDIEVDNTPAAVIDGGDPQLERAIEEVLRRMKEDPKSLPARPADPIKTPQSKR